MTAVTLTADMPIQISGEMGLRIRRGERVVVVKSLPREMFVDAHERQCQTNHGQTLERIRERKGFDATETVAVLSCLRFDAVGCLGEEAAHRILYSWHSTFNRGKLLAARNAA